MVVVSSKAVKDWLPERWAEVVDALEHDFGFQTVLVGGPSERDGDPDLLGVGPARDVSQDELRAFTDHC